MSQVDVDVRWAKKGEESFFGYKSHVKCDSESKIIVAFSVMDASVYDGLEFVGLIDEKDEDVKVDSAYVGDYRDEILRLFSGVRVHICDRVYRNKPLSEAEKVGSRVIARVRARVEHVFGYMTRFMVGISCRVHGLGRVGRGVACKNLAYNLCRFMFLVG
jgi:IS5 family transposase